MSEQERTEVQPEAQSSQETPQHPPDGWNEKGELWHQGVVVDRVHESSRLFIRPDDPPLPEEVQREIEEGRKAKEQLEQYEPVINIAQRPEFREWLNDQIELGVIPPPAVDPPTEADVVGHTRRTKEPFYQEVHAEVVKFADTLPEHEKQVLATNHREYNRIYDSIKAQLKAQREQLEQENFRSMPIAMRERIIQSKEKAKESAYVEPPGGVPSAPNPEKEARKEISYWRARSQDRNLTPTQRGDAEIQLVNAYFNLQKGKK